MSFTKLDYCQYLLSTPPTQTHRGALLVWSRLKHLAYHGRRSVYQIKHGLLNDYLVQQLKNPSVQMVLA